MSTGQSGGSKPSTKVSSTLSPLAFRLFQRFGELRGEQPGVAVGFLLEKLALSPGFLEELETLESLSGKQQK